MTIIPIVPGFFAGFKFEQISLTGSSFNVTGKSIAVKPDGTRILVLNGATVTIYDLLTANDLSTISFVGTISLSTVGSNLNSLRLSGDGLKLFVLDVGASQVARFNLSEAWGGTATYVNSVTMATANSNPDIIEVTARQMCFSDDGETMFGVGTVQLANAAVLDDVLVSRTLGTGFDLTVVSDWGVPNYNLRQFDTVKGFRVVNDGFNLVYCQDGSTYERVQSADLTTANDISTLDTPSTSNTLGDVTPNGAPLDLDYGLNAERLYALTTSKILEFRTIG